MSYDRLMYAIASGETLDLTAATNTLTHTLTDPVLLEHAVIRYITSADVGTRNVALQILDGADVLITQMAGDISQAASATRYYAFGRSIGSDAAFVFTTLRRPLHLYRLEAGWKIKAVDVGNVAVADSIRLTATLRRMRQSLTV